MKTDYLFQQFRPMIEGAAWTAAKRYQIEVTELRSQAYLIFCEAVERFDSSRAYKGKEEKLFESFLFNRLRTINDFAKDFKKKTDYIPFINEQNDYKIEICLKDTRIEDFEIAMDKLESGLALSEDAQEIIDFIISRQWETPGFNRVPRLHSVQRYYRYWKGWMPQRTARAWEEIRTWWKSGNHLMEVV